MSLLLYHARRNRHYASSKNITERHQTALLFGSPILKVLEFHFDLQGTNETVSSNGP